MCIHLTLVFARLLDSMSRKSIFSHSVIAYLDGGKIGNFIDLGVSE